jgi:hypothetical protein
MGRINLPEPTVTFVAGGPATGKTTLLEKLVPEVNDGFLIDVDDVKDSFLSTPDRERMPKFEVGWFKLDGERRSSEGDFYRDNVGMHSYKAMLEQATTNFRLGKNPFAQGNYTGQIASGYFDKVVHPFFKERGLNPRVKMLFCHAEPELIAKRIRERNAARDAEKIEFPDAMEKYLDSQNFLPKALESLDHVKLDGAHSVAHNAGLAEQYLLGYDV